VRAIVDADRLPHAVPYYNMFPAEPAQQLKDYISVQPLDPVRNLTLELLLKRLEGYASGGEKEFLIVLHSTPEGLRLPVGDGPLANVNAHQSVLKIIALASVAFGNLDDSKDPDMAVNAAFLQAWMDFFNSTPNKVDTSAISQASDIASKCAEAAKLGQRWIDGACKAMQTSEARLRDLAALADRVRRAGIERLEFRSCRLGAGGGLKEVADFFGAMSFAPTVRTFYVRQPVQIVARQAQLNRLASGLGTHSRRFTSQNADAGAGDPVAFAIQVIPLPEAKYISKMFAINEQAVWNWVVNFILRLPTSVTVNNVPVPVQTARTLSHDLCVAGLRTDGEARPFVFPGEPDYRSHIEGQF
jgi:hypothetical protein